ncbi:MAG: hypothetical protein L3K14_09915 [Thermoplasmata archaeon]|nr:hypothetical protein [Thermoplasmata archaeon]
MRRRSVYIGTIVAVLAMAGGFALAAFPGTFTLFGGTSSGQNTGTFTGGSTIWSAGASVALVQAASPVASCALSYTGTAANVYLAGSLACATGGATHWYEEFQLTATEVATNSDTFHWYVVGGANAADQSFTVAQSVTYTGAVTLNVFFDMGAATASPGTVTSISATVTGS